MSSCQALTLYFARPRVLSFARIRVQLGDRRLATGGIAGSLSKTPADSSFLVGEIVLREILIDPEPLLVGGNFHGSDGGKIRRRPPPTSPAPSSSIPASIHAMTCAASCLRSLDIPRPGWRAAARAFPTFRSAPHPSAAHLAPASRHGRRSPSLLSGLPGNFLRDIWPPPPRRRPTCGWAPARSDLHAISQIPAAALSNSPASTAALASR